MRSWYLTILLAGSCAISAGQIRITNTQTVPLPPGQFWMAPGWAPDGQAFYVTSPQYRGLWRYDLHRGVLLQITDDAGAGFGWAVSADGARIAYRRTVEGLRPGDRTQEIVAR